MKTDKNFLKSRTPLLVGLVLLGLGVGAILLVVLWLLDYYMKAF